MLSQGVQTAVDKKLERVKQDANDAISKWGGVTNAGRQATRASCYFAKFENQIRNIGHLVDALETRGDKDAALAVLALLGS